MKRFLFLIVCLFALTVCSFPTLAQRSFTAINSPVTENFDTLAATGADLPFADNLTLSGWYTTRPFYSAGTGMGSAGTHYSYGTSSSSVERALGSVASGGPGNILYGLRIQNNTGTMITSLAISYVGEQWRKASGEPAQSLTFEYRQAPTISDLTGSYSALDSLDFTTPIFGTTPATALNGNLAANRTTLAATIPVIIPPGQEIMLRWTDINDAGNDHGLAVDDLVVTPQRAPFTFIVDTFSDDAGLTACTAAAGDCSLRGAVSIAMDGDQIEFAMPAPIGIVPAIVLTSEILIDDDIEINGPGSTLLAIDGGPGTNRLFRINGADAEINNLTLTGGNGNGGGFVGMGGAVQLQSGTLSMNDVNIHANSASVFGGAVGIASTGTAFTLTNATLTGNSSGVGGAIFSINAAAVMDISNTLFDGNSATSQGGAIQATGTTTIADSTFISNTANNPGSASFGGAVAVSGGSTTTITATTFSQNSALGGAGSGGAIHSQGATLVLEGVTFTGNNSVTNGGGLNVVTSGSFAANTTITSCTFDGNSSLAGGGILNRGGTAVSTMTIDSSAIINNDSDVLPNGVGGGIRNTSPSPGTAVLTITNSTISGNASATGGGLALDANSVVNLNFVTVAFNTASGSGGGISSESANTFLKNTIVANNSAPASPIIGGDFTSLNYNHFHSPPPFSGKDDLASFGGLEPNDVVGPDPLLTPLALNGGTTLNHRPGNVSPVFGSIPAGVNDCGTTAIIDQRGNSRPVSGACEKGSVEALGPTAAAVTVSGTVRTAGGLPIRAASVTIFGGDLSEPVTVATGSFGIYSFNGLRAGQTYFVMVLAGRHAFAEPVRTVVPMDSVDDLDFVAN